MNRVSLSLSAGLLAGLVVFAAGGQDGAVFKDPTSETLLRAARLAVGHGEAKVLALRSLILKGKSRVVLGDQPPVDASVEIRVLLPDNYLRIDTAAASRLITGFSGKRLLTAIDDGDSLSAPPANLHAGLLKLEQARLARLLLGMACYVSPYYFVTFRAMGGQTEMVGPLDGPARSVVRQGRLDANVIEGAGRDGFYVRLFFNAERYPITLAYRGTKDTMNEMSFADRREVQGLNLPFRILTKDTKRTTDELMFDRIELNAPLTAEDFVVPRR